MSKSPDKGYHSNVMDENRGGKNESGKTTGHHCHNISEPHVCVTTFVCVCVVCAGPTSPGVVVVGHSVCGLDGGDVGLQGKQLTGQVWHTAREDNRGNFFY